MNPRKRASKRPPREWIDPDSLPPEERAEFLRKEGIRICREKALRRANRKGRAMVVLDRGEGWPEAEGHRFVPRSLAALVLEPGWEIVLIVEPQPGAQRGKKREKRWKKRGGKNKKAMLPSEPKLE